MSETIENQIENEEDLALQVQRRMQLEQEAKDYRYNPEHTLHKVGFVQNKMLDAVANMDMEDLLFKPQIMENVNTLLNNMNGTAVQVTRNSIVESSSNLGAMADAVVERMAQQGLTTIKTVTPDSNVKGKVPTNLVIEDADFEEIQPGMLQRGLINQTYDDFADNHGLAKTE